MSWVGATPAEHSWMKLAIAVVSSIELFRFGNEFLGHEVIQTPLVAVRPN